MRQTIPPLSSPSGSDEAWRQIRQSVSRLADQSQPFHVAPTQSGTFTVSEVYGFYPCDASATAMTANLPPAKAHKGKRYAIKKIDGTANVVTVDGSGSETIDGSTTQPINTQYQTLTVVSDGSQWWVIS